MKVPLARLVQFLFGCLHPRYTWPRTDRKTGESYVACLDCGQRLGYSTRQAFKRTS